MIYLQVSAYGSTTGFVPGTTIYLEGSFASGIIIDLSKSFGSATSKLRITSLNPSSPATIASSSHGIYISAATGTAKGLGIQIDNVVITSSGGSGMYGIYLLAPAGIRLDTLVVDSVDISGFAQGMRTWRASASTPFVINVIVSNSKFHNNAAGGILLGGTAGATITGCEASWNSWNGPGISGTDSDLMTITNCNSHDNMGIGYTIAEGMTNSVISNCKSVSNYYAAYVVIGRNLVSMNNGGAVNNAVFKDSNSTNDGLGYKFVINGIWTDGIMAATNVAFENMNILNSGGGATTGYFGTGVFDAYWLVGSFNMTTKNVVFTFPSVTYSADLTCDSAFSTLCI